MTTPSRTQPGRLSEVARRLVLPSGLTATEWPAIKRRTDQMGIRFDQWQADLVRGAVAKRKNGKYAATVGGIVWSLPRQVGKTFTVGSLLFAYAIEHPGSLVLWTAHHTRTSGETFKSMQAMARKPRVAPYVEQVYTGSGTESVVFKNGSRILFGARDQGFGLGFAAVDVIVFDEAQRLSDRTRMDMVPATNRAHNPAGALLFYIGTPPRPDDNGEGFASLRSGAVDGDDDVFFVELSADPDAEPDDREQWAKANPSFPHHTPVESMLRMRKHLGSDEAWMREALGIWDAKGSSRVIDERSWDLVADPASMPIERLTLAVDVAPDRSVASVSLAGQRADGLWHVELDEHRKGVDWIPGWIKQRAERNRLHAVVADELAGVTEKRKNGRHYLAGTDVEVTLAASGGRDMTIACAKFFDAVMDGSVRHTDQPQVNVALSVAGKRDVMQGVGWAWNKKTAEADITPIVSQTLALWGAQNVNVKKPAKTERRKVVVRS